MVKNFCCPNCGSHEVYQKFVSETVKKSEPIFIHWHCTDCNSRFIAPQDIAFAISDILRENDKSFKSAMRFYTATAALAIFLLLSILFKDSIVGIIFSICLICASALGIIISGLKRRSAIRTAKRLELELENTELKMESYTRN